MVNSGGFNNLDEPVAEAAEAQENMTDETMLTESGEIDTGANSNEVFSDSAPGDESSAAEDREGDDDENTESGGLNKE